MVSNGAKLGIDLLFSLLSLYVLLLDILFELLLSSLRFLVQLLLLLNLLLLLFTVAEYTIRALISCRHAR